MDSGHRPRHQAACDGRRGHPQRRLRLLPAPTVDVRRRGTRSARSTACRSTTLRNLQIAFARTGAVSEHRRDRGGAVNAWPRASSAGRSSRTGSSKLDFDTASTAPRPASGRPARARPRRLRVLRRDRRHRAYVVNNHRTAAQRGPFDRPVPAKIQTARSRAVERHSLRLEQQVRPAGGEVNSLLISSSKPASSDGDSGGARPALRRLQHRSLDYINSVATRWPGTRVPQPQHRRRHHEIRLHADYRGRVRRAVNTPTATATSRSAGGMQPNIPSARRGIALGMKRALARGEDEQQAGASGKWVAHWKMVPHRAGRIWERPATANSWAAPSALTYGQTGRGRPGAAGAGGRAPVRGARDMLSVALQYGNASAALPGGGAQRPTTSATTTSFT